MRRLFLYFRKYWYGSLSLLVLVLPLLFLSTHLDLMRNAGRRGPFAVREIGNIPLGPWTIRLGEADNSPPEEEGLAGFVKTFMLSLDFGINPPVKAIYLKVRKPRNLRTAGALFVGTPYRMSAEVVLPRNIKSSDELWLTGEAWDGSVHQVPISLSVASPATLAWLKKRQGSD